MDHKLSPSFILRGIVFHSTVRGGHASLTVSVTDDGDRRKSNCGDCNRNLAFPGERGESWTEKATLSKENSEKQEKVILVIIRFGGSEWSSPHDSCENSFEGSDQPNAEVICPSQCGNKPDRKQNEEIPISTPRKNESVTLMRSNIRRMCKLGNEMEFFGTFSVESNKEATPNGSACGNVSPKNDYYFTRPRFVVDYFLPSSPDLSLNSGRPVIDEASNKSVRIIHVQRWDSRRCQIERAKYFPPSVKNQPIKRSPEVADGNLIQQSKKRYHNSQTEQYGNHARARAHSGGGIGKHKQGEILANFLLWMLSTIYNRDMNRLTLAKSQNISLYETAKEHNKPINVANTNIDPGTGKGTVEESLQTESVELKHMSAKNFDTMRELNEENHLWTKRLVPLDSSLLNLKNSHASSDPSTIRSRNALVAKELGKFSSSGIIDAAGGAGHVSLALALRGIHSTVVDPRKTVGVLPKRDRKVLKKALAKQEKDKSYLEPSTDSEKVVPFSTFRAWFGSKPEGVDTFFREGYRKHEYESNVTPAQSTNSPVLAPKINDTSKDDIIDPTSIPICSMCSDDGLLAKCSAIVALHPDEATGSIVETAVEHKIPFVVVPCCVFSRLFPHRIKPLSDTSANCYESEVGDKFSMKEINTVNNETMVVRTYHDLIDWLVVKHPSIRVTRLPFDGANLAVWATFL